MEGGCRIEGFLEEVELEQRITKIFNKGKGRGRYLTKATKAPDEREARQFRKSQQFGKAEEADWRGRVGGVFKGQEWKGGSRGQKEPGMASH